MFVANIYIYIYVYIYIYIYIIYILNEKFQMALIWIGKMSYLSLSIYFMIFSSFTGNLNNIRKAVIKFNWINSRSLSIDSFLN